MTTLSLRDLGFVGGLSGGYTPTHPETINWQSRVASAGGTASTATLQAMDTFCAAIDAESGLRGAITRLNLFCGNQLAAALVPLYRAESAGATAKGNATDTNVNFLEGNYTSGGLGKANNTNSYLNTGLATTQFGTSTSQHLSVSATDCATAAVSGDDRIFMGSYYSPTGGPGLLVLDDLAPGYTAPNYRMFRCATGLQPPVTGTTLQAAEAHLIGTRTVNTVTLYRAGSSAAAYTNSTAFAAAIALNTYVFCLNFDNSPSVFTKARLRMYSIGSGLTAAQAAAFSSAVAAFNSALGR